MIFSEPYFIIITVFLCFLLPGSWLMLLGWVGGSVVGHLTQGWFR